MATEEEARQAGFSMPQGDWSISGGDNSIRQNARVALNLTREAAYIKGSPTGPIDDLPLGIYRITDPTAVTGLPRGATSGQLERTPARDTYINDTPAGTFWERRRTESGTFLKWSIISTDLAVPLALTRPLAERLSTVTSRSIRIPFRVAGRVKASRIHIRNINYRTNTAYPGQVTLRTVNIGTAGTDSDGEPTSSFVATEDFPSGQRVIVRDTTVDDMGDGWTSWWITDGFKPGVNYMLTFGYQTNGQDIQTSMGGGWQTDGKPNNAELPSDPTAARTGRLPFDVHLELVMENDTPRDVVIGDSIAAAANATMPVFEAPAAISSRQTARVSRLHTFGGAAFGEVFGGAWTDPNSLKWKEITDYGRADRLIIALGNNDINAGDSLQTLKDRISAVARIGTERISSNLTVCTITPRTSWAGTEKDTIRQEFNDWVRSFPAGVDAVADTARAVEDDTGTAPRSDYAVSDGIHFNTAGSKALAAAITTAYVQSDNLDALSYRSGLRSLNGLVASRVSGDLTIERVGDIVTLSANNLRLSESGSGTFLSSMLPIGWRPSTTVPVIAKGLSSHLQVSYGGNVQAYEWAANTPIYVTITYAVKEPAQSVPGTPA